MEQRAPTLLSSWSAPAKQARSLLAAPVEGDLDAYTRTLASVLDADEALVTLHSEDEAASALEVASFGDLLTPGARLQLGSSAAQRVAGRHGWAQSPIDPDWSTCVLDGRIWQVLRLPVWSQRARTCVLISLMFETASSADMSTAVGKLQISRPLIEPYLRLWQRTRVRNRDATGLRGALDSLEIGVILVNRSSKIVFANKSATIMLKSGEPLRRTGEGFAASDLRQAVPLQVALSHAIADNVDASARDVSDMQAEAAPRRGSVLALRSQRLGRSLVLSVVPASNAATEPADAAAIVYIIDPKLDTTKQLQPVCVLFGLSPVETRLVCLLTAGQTLQDAAKAMRIKDQTARSYLKQIFSKTDTRRQADLVRVMLCSLLRIERSIEPVSLKTAG